ncbi:MAG TPA: hypothetical protein VMV91_14440 [Rhodocyclaceae bacterium]|nr:hypothetical protein [Rhodocyclaceae bacterium]
MVIVMDTVRGMRIEDEFGAFEEEVLNAQWLPQPALQPGPQLVHPAAAARVAPAFDAEAFLRTVYLSQE